jgi:retron-type reverse transcriptase
MGLERRGRADQGQPGANPQGEEPRARPGPKVKSFEIDKRLIVEAWEKVRANNGAPGVDAVGIGLFAEQLRDNLFKLWNKMSSGSYFPGPVRGVEIPKDHGEGVRLLGVPNTGDRVAQTAAAMLLEQKLEPVFHRDSYGYRPGRSAQWPCFKVCCDNVTVLWLMMVLRVCRRTAGCRTGSRSGC